MPNKTSNQSILQRWLNKTKKLASTKFSSFEEKSHKPKLNIKNITFTKEAFGSRVFKGGQGVGSLQEGVKRGSAGRRSVT